MGIIVKVIVNFLLGCGRPVQTAAFQRIGLVMGSKMGVCKGHVCPTAMLPGQRIQLCE